MANFLPQIRQSRKARQIKKAITNDAMRICTPIYIVVHNLTLLPQLFFDNDNVPYKGIKRNDIVQAEKYLTTDDIDIECGNICYFAESAR